MGQRGKSKLWPWLVGLNGAIKNPLSPVASGLIEVEQCWEQIDHDKDTQEIKADVQAIREALQDTPDDQLAEKLRELGRLSGLRPEDLRRIVRRRALALGLVSDEERVTEYRDWVLRQYMYADFRGIAQTTTIVSSIAPLRRCSGGGRGNERVQTDAQHDWLYGALYRSAGSCQPFARAFVGRMSQK